MNKFLVLCIASLALIFACSSCNVSQIQYNKLKSQLEKVQVERNQVQSDNGNLQRQVIELQKLLSDRQLQWPGYNVYIDAARTITVKTGEEFIIAYDLGNEQFIISVNEDHDAAFITSMGKQVTYSQIMPGIPDMPGKAWFLFKAVKPGNTQITVNHVGHLNLGVEDPETFTVVITD